MTSALGVSLALSLLVPRIASPSSSLHGVVRDEQGGAIRGAVVEVVCASVRQRTVTDSAGEFAVAVVAGPCTVTAESTAFKRETVNVDLTGTNLHVTLILALHEFATEIVVTPTRGFENRDSPFPRRRR